ncbi:MAG TPA: CPBP family intramembrane metalloprotease [Clostridiales bacterium]|nr:CPBP family intramembrane metalloprotease [Clostridiales bacterium]
MKKFKGIFGCIMAFVYALIIQVVVALISSIMYGMFMGVTLAMQGIEASEIEIRIEEAMTGDFVIAISAMAALISLLLYAIWYYKKLAKKNRPSIKQVFDLKTILVVIGLGISMQIGISAILDLLAPVLPEAFNKYEKLIEGLGMGNSAISFIYIGLIAPFSEEYIFRGVIFNKAKKVIPFLYANILQAILFGIMHGNTVQGSYAFVLGLFLGILYERRQSIFAPIALHMVLNLSGILFSFIPESFSKTYAYVFIILQGLAILGIAYTIMVLNRNQIVIEEEIEMIEIDL